MGLKEQQRFLARLYTDADFYALYFSKPTETARVFGLNDEEAATFAELCPAQVKYLARELDELRMEEMTQIMPAVFRALGHRAGEVFRHFCRKWRPSEDRPCSCAATLRRQHLREARAFVRFLRNAPPRLRLPDWISELATFELRRARQGSSRLFLDVGFHRYPVHKIANCLLRRGVISGFERHSTLHLAIRTGRWLSFSLPFRLPEWQKRGAESESPSY